MFIGSSGPYAFMPSNIVPLRVSVFDSAINNKSLVSPSRATFSASNEQRRSQTFLKVSSSASSSVPYNTDDDIRIPMSVPSPTIATLQHGSKDKDMTSDVSLHSSLLEASLNMELISKTIQPTTKKTFPWILLFACILISKFGGGVPCHTFKSSPLHFLQAGVSSTLLRRSPYTIFPSISSGNNKNLLNRVLSWKTCSSLWLMWQISILSLSAMPMLIKSITNFFGWYMLRLETAPLVTNILTTAVIGLLGDSGAQYFEERIQTKKKQPAEQELHQQQMQPRQESTSSVTRRKPRFLDAIKNYDLRRGISNLADSIFLSGPLMYFAYTWMETILPVESAASGVAATLAALGHVLMDDFILDGIFIAIMFITTGIGEGYNPSQISTNLKNDLVPAIRASFAASLFLLPIEFSLFRFLPPTLRVLGMNILDIFWGAMISFIAHRSRHKPTVEDATVSTIVDTTGDSVNGEEILAPALT